VVLALAVVTAALVSFGQTRVAATDACAVLAAAARSAGVGAATAQASPIKLPSSLSGSWTACAYGDGADRARPWLLFRSGPTEGREVPGLVVALRTSTGSTSGFAFGTFSPVSTTDGTERWIAAESTRASGLGQSMAVLADPYFFVVTAPSPDGTARLAEAVRAELRQRPLPPLSGTSKTDACAVIRRAAPRAGLPTTDASGSPLTTNRHWADVFVRDTHPNIWTANNVCGFGADNGWSDPHLWLRDEPTTLQQANELLPLAFALDGVGGSRYDPVDRWVEIEAGMWLAHGQEPPAYCGECGATIDRWSAVAVLNERHFFVVTQATDEAAIQLARAVLAELRRP
jgi:hypothetical protein